jgi:hypothetical protein
VAALLQILYYCICKMRAFVASKCYFHQCSP